MRHSQQVYVISIAGEIQPDAPTSLQDVAGLLNNKPSYRTLQRHFASANSYKKGELVIAKVTIKRIKRSRNMAHLSRLNTTNG